MPCATGVDEGGAVIRLGFWRAAFGFRGQGCGWVLVCLLTREIGRGSHRREAVLHV